MEERSVTLDAARGLERHRADGRTIRWQPVRVGEKEFPARLEVDHRGVERAAEPSEQVILPLGRFPLNRVTAEWPRHAERAAHLPPGAERLGVEEGLQDNCGGCLDDQAVGEFWDRHASGY